MDAVEIARRLAANLHARAVARGLDPSRPYEFAVAEAAGHGLDVEVAAADAVVLDGGRATLAAADALIMHVDSGSDFERAFLVAHEIGHFLLGDAGHEPVRDIDPVRAAEACPIGADRVVDYGRRQRREVQMDLFARELLLPRELVRRLHMEEGLSATAIASRYQAPFEVVAQQLFDALLLPVVADAATEPAPERPLNEEQRSAVAHRGVAYLLGAGPGTGKTQTLIARLEGLLDAGVHPRNILVLTFSNKAAEEMADRFARRRGPAAAAMWIGTFHAFGLDVIRRFHAELDLPADPMMMDRTEAAELLENEFPRLGLVHYRDIYDPTRIIDQFLSAFSRAKDEVVDEATYAELAVAMESAAHSAEDHVAAERAMEVARAYRAYEILKRRANRIDFGDLVALPVRLLETNDAVKAYFAGRYEHVLVDEYQDVNRASVRLLKALCVDGRNLWAVGDAKQSIYRFRGASSFNMALFGTKDFPDAAGGRLKVNYRSVPEIVRAFSTFAIEMTADGSTDALVADRGSAGLEPEILTVATGQLQAVVLADSIAEIRRVGWAYRDQAVLCTGNERLASIGRELERLGVPVLYLGSLFERPEVKELLSLLSMIVDRRAMGLVRLACRDDFSMSLADVDGIVADLREREPNPLSWLEDADAFPGLSMDGAAALGRMRKAFEGFGLSSSPWIVLAKVMLDRTRWAAEIAASDHVAERSKGLAIWQFMNFVRVQPHGDGVPITRLLDRVRRLIRLGDDRDLRHLPSAARGIDGVRLMTVHGAKGLEFPVIHFPGMNSDTMPRAFEKPKCPPPDGMIQGGAGSSDALLREAHDEEQECLFYVALSRARDRLFLYAATSRTDGARRPFSCFLNRIGTGTGRRDVTPSRPPVPAPEDEAVTIDVHGALRFEVSRLALYDACPRRFLYTHVLRLGGKRVATSFMLMHDAVRTVVQAIIVRRPPPSATEMDGLLDAALVANGLADHGYLGDYRALAAGMVRYFLATREGYDYEAPPAISLTFGGEEIIVTPDDFLLRGDGRRILRRVRTGHETKSHRDDVAAAAFMLAARQAFPGAVADIVYLADETAAPRPLDLTARVMENRRQKLGGMLAAIREGRFPTKASERVCPGCPAFFVCGPMPSGTLRRKF